MNSKKPLLVLVFVVILFFLPFLVKPGLLTSRDNDLGRTYIPLYTFIKNSILADKQIPLWRPDQMMGESFIANPLSTIVYLPNILFVLFPVNAAVVFYYILHLLLAAFGAYFLSRDLNFDRISSLCAALFFAISTKMLLHLSAGHITMIAAAAFIPLSVLSVRKLSKTPDLLWVILGSISLSASYITYPTIFYYTLIFIIFYTLYINVYRLFENKVTLINIARYTKPFFLLGFVTFGLCAISLFPQLEFGPLSTRSNLSIGDVALPLWNFKRLLVSLLFPYPDLFNLDQEAFLYLGAVPTLLSVLGIYFLPKTKKILVIIFGLLAVSYSAGLSTPVFKLAYNFFPLIKYSRVSTRIWFIVALVVALLAAYALGKIKSKKLKLLFVVIFLAENFTIGYLKIFQIPNLDFQNTQIYKFLSSDSDTYRVYCTTYCFNPQLIGQYKIKLLAGETPIQDKNFINFLSLAGNYNWKNFAVIFPPYQIWQSPNPPQPDAALLGQANVKYIASSYQLTGNNFKEVSKFQNLYLYQNNNYKQKFYFLNSDEKIIQNFSTPNAINLKFAPVSYQREIIISQNHYPGWNAYSNNKKIEVKRFQGVFNKVTIPPQSSDLWLVYQPKSYELGKTVTFITIIFVILCYIHRKKNR